MSKDGDNDTPAAEEAAIMKGLEVHGDVAVTRPDYLNTLGWIQRERLSWAEFQQHAADQNLPEPSLMEWWVTFTLTDDELDELNAMIEAHNRPVADMIELSHYFFVRHFGNKPRVCWRQGSGLLGHMSVPEFKTAYLEKKAEVVNKKGETSLKPLVDIWLHANKTPRFDRVEFLPGKLEHEVDADVFNLWGGWPEGLPRERDLRVHRLGDLIPEDDAHDGPQEPDECWLFLEHLQQHVCGGDEDAYLYLLGWMADGLLRPGRSEVAVAMTGPSGSGKGTVAEFYGSFFGPHYLAVNDQDSLTGKFNRHLMEAQLVFGDEVDFSDSGQASKTLRNLVTEPTLMIQPKGVDTFQAPKWFRIMLATNEKHVIDALHDDRRYLVLNVDAGEHNQDRAYFRDMRDQWTRGGQRALFRWLTGRWWQQTLADGDWEVGDRPVTDTLRRQKIMSLSDGDQLLLGIIEDGELPGERPSGRHVPPHTRVSNDRERPERGLLEAMRRRAPSLRNASDQRLTTLLKEWGCANWQSSSQRGWTFPPLAEMRAAFVARYGEHNWPEGDEWAGEHVEPDPPF